MTDSLCSICLVMEVRVFEFVDSDPKRFIESIFVENGFHQMVSFEKMYICYKCKALLEKTYKFVQKALTAQQVVRDMLYKTSYMITLDQLKAINRKALGLDVNLSKHEVNIDFCYFDNKEENERNLTAELRENDYIAKNNEFDVPDPLYSIQNKNESIRNENKPECMVEIDELITADPLQNMQSKEEKIEIKFELNCKAVSTGELNVTDSLGNVEFINESVATDTKYECITKIDEHNDVHLLNNTQNKRKTIKVEDESDTISDALNYLDNSEFMEKVSLTPDIKYNVPITAVDDPSSEVKCNNIVPDDETVIMVNRNKTVYEDPDYDPIYPQPKKRHKTEKQKAKKVYSRKDYKPSVFMLNLSTFAEKKRQRNVTKYVHSDDSDSSKMINIKETDNEYDPKCSNYSEDNTDDSMYDRYDDSGRRKRKPDEREYPMECDHCEAEIPEKRVHYYHYLINHPNTKYPYSRKRVKTVCQFCGHISSDKHRNTMHELTHSSESAFACHKCPKKFKNQLRLRKHLTNTHTSRFLECDFCGKNFKTRSEITLHIRIHTGEKPFKCHICGAGFAHKGNVGIHIRSKHQGLSQITKKSKTENKTKKEKKRKRRTYSNIEEEDEPLINFKK